MRRILYVFIFCCLPALLFAQLTVKQSSDELTPSMIVKNYFTGDGVKVFNVTFKGEQDALGYFKDSAYSTGFGSGLVIGTGRVELIAGKNVKPNTSSNFGNHFFFDEDLISKSDMCDGAVLEFDFIPAYDSVVFNFLFGSEEYPEFVGKEFNDIFAFLLYAKWMPGAKPKNIALLPDKKNVMINNVNHRMNKQFYVSNDAGSYHYDKLEFDGFTKALTAASKVVANKVYHMKIIIADLGDCEYDSGVLLETRSFRSIPRNAKKHAPVKKNYYFNFSTDAFSLSAKEQLKVKKLADSLSKFVFDSVIVIGHTDSTGAEEHNVLLSTNRASYIATLLEQYGLKSNRFIIKGKGSSEPLNTNQTTQGKAQNRRVEIIFYRKPS